MGKKSQHGGARSGSGRKPKHGVAKVSHTLTITPELKAYLQTVASGSELIETAIRKTRAFRDWKAAQPDQ